MSDGDFPTAMVCADCADRKRATLTAKRATLSQNDIRNLNIDERLSYGYATGAVTFTTQDGVKLRVKNGPRGRGLFAAGPIATNSVVASFEFTLSTDGSQMAANEHLFSGYKVIWSKTVEANLHRPNRLHLGSLTNTSRSSVGNNCRIVVSFKNRTIRLVSTRNISDGEECLTPYGKQFHLSSGPDPTDEYDGDGEEVTLVTWLRLGNNMLRCPQPNCGFTCRTLKQAGGHETMGACWGRRNAGGVQTG